MRLPSTKVMLFNAAAIVVTVAAVLAAGRSMFTAPVTPLCTERYLKMTAFGLERAGVMLTATDLQAMSGGRDFGVIDNVSVIRKDGATPAAMEVRLSKGASGRQGGMGFPWQPRALAGKTAACLTYQVFFPADFDFRRGGRLPGFGSGPADAPQSQQVLVAVPAWSASGRSGAVLHVPPGETTLIQAQADLNFARGRWVKVDQEVVLNTPKSADGVLRVWLDGELAIERKEMNYRATDKVTLSSVVADVHFTSSSAATDKPANVWLSPFEVRWQ